MSIRIPIPYTVNDPFYRYHRNMLNIMNNSKEIIIDNIHMIAKQLDRHPKELVLFIKKNINRQVNFKNEVLSIPNHKNQTIDFEKILNNYIDHYVICKHCGNPETIYVIQNKSLILRCKACGNLTDCKDKHSLINIIKNI